MTNYIKRIVYFGYYVRQLDWRLLAKFMIYVRTETGLTKLQQWRSIISDSLRFNTSILEYYQFRFFEIEDDEKATWAGTGTMYEFQRTANPLETRDLLSDKRKFYKAYKRFFRHELHSIAELRSDAALVNRLLDQNHRLVFKEATGNCGVGVAFEDVDDFNVDSMISYMNSNDFDLVETFVEQHSVLNLLSPSAVNTVRIFTQIRSTGEFEMLGARLRISVNSQVDNLAAGNLAAPIKIESGVVCGPGVYSDITRPAETVHPITDQSIVGLVIPHWQETLDMIREASLLYPQNRSIGWDVVVTEDGPGLIEGNHDWCKLVWQLPVKRGLKGLLEINQ